VAEPLDPAQPGFEQGGVFLLDQEGDAIDGNGHRTEFEFVTPLDLQDERIARAGVDTDDVRRTPLAGGVLAPGRVMKGDHPLHHLGGFAGAVAVRMPAFRQNGEFVPEAGWVCAEQALRFGWRDCQDLRSGEGLEKWYGNLSCGYYCIFYKN